MQDIPPKVLYVVLGIIQMRTGEFPAMQDFRIQNGERVKAILKYQFSFESKKIPLSVTGTVSYDPRDHSASADFTFKDDGKETQCYINKCE